MQNPKSYYTKSEANLIIKACRNYRDKLLLLTLAKTGRRVSEIVRCLKPVDIDFDQGLVNYTILKRKVHTKKLLPMDTHLLSLLEKYIKSRRIGPDDYIFKISRQRVDQIIKRAAKKVGVKTAHAHVFRHSFAIQSAQKLKNPADLVQLKELMGHARMDTTMFYLKFNPREQRELLEEMWK